MSEKEEDVCTYLMFSLYDTCRFISFSSFIVCTTLFLISFFYFYKLLTGKLLYYCFSTPASAPTHQLVLELVFFYLLFAIRFILNSCEVLHVLSHRLPIALRFV